VLIGAGSNMNEFVDGSNSSADETMLLAELNPPVTRDEAIVRSVIVKKSGRNSCSRPL